MKPEILVYDDLDWLLEVTVEFNDKWYGVPINREKTLRTLEEIIMGPAGVGFRTDHGAIIGTIEDDPFRDYTVLQERGWYATDRSGIALLDTFVNYGHELGVDEVRVGNLHSNPGVSKLLERKGFTPVETSHGLGVSNGCIYLNRCRSTSSS